MNENAKKDVQKDSLLHLTKPMHKNEILTFKTKLDDIQAQVKHLSNMHQHEND